MRLLAKVSLWIAFIAAWSLPASVVLADDARRPDPGDDGDWLAWIWVDAAETPGREPIVDALCAVGQGLAERIVPKGDDGLVFKAAFECARAGCPTAISLVPGPDGTASWRGVIRNAEVAKRVLKQTGPGRGGAPEPADAPLKALRVTTRADADAVDLAGAGTNLFATEPDKQPRTPLSTESLHEWPSHRRACGSRRAVFEIAVNLNAWRKHAGDGFDTGVGGGLLDALRLSNARVAGLHGFVVPADRVMTRDPSLPKVGGPPPAYNGAPILSLVASWTARSEPPGQPRTWAMTTDYWPAQQLGAPPSDGSAVVLAARVAWRKVLPGAAAAYAAMLPAADRDGFGAFWGAWLREHGAEADRFASGLEPWVALNVPGGGGSPKLDLRVGLRGDAAQAASALDKLLATASGSTVRGRAISGVRVHPSGPWRRLFTMDITFHDDPGKTGWAGATWMLNRADSQAPPP